MSRIEKAISVAQAAQQARNARQAEQEAARDKSPTGILNATTLGAYKSLSNLLKALTATHLESQVLEKHKLLPGISDRHAITAYKMLRTRVLQRMRSNEWQTLIVTGAGPGEGKTLTACNLAISIANDVNQSVVLVDLDLQRPSVAEYFGLTVEAGIGDYLRNEAEIEDIICTPEGLDRMLIVPNRAPVPNSSELLATPRMDEFVNAARKVNPSTIIIFDMPPMLVCDDVLAFSPNADSLLLVASEGLTDRGGLKDTIEMLTSTNLMGIVLNRSTEHSTGTDYYY